MAIVVEQFPAMLSTGDFVITVRGEGRGVCQLLAVEFPQLVKVQWWLTPYDNFFMFCITECFEAFSAVSYSVNDVIDLGFVFHVDSLEHHWVNCAGMV